MVLNDGAEGSLNGTRPHPPISPRTFFWVSTPAPHLSQAPAEVLVYFPRAAGFRLSLECSRVGCENTHTLPCSRLQNTFSHCTLRAAAFRASSMCRSILFILRVLTLKFSLLLSEIIVNLTFGNLCRIAIARTTGVRRLCLSGRWCRWRYGYVYVCTCMHICIHIRMCMYLNLCI